MLGKSALSDNGSRQSGVRAGERKEERIALRVDLAALAISHRLAQDPAVDFEDLAVPVAELPQKPGRALDVREEEGDGSPRELDHAAQAWRLAVDPSSAQYAQGTFPNTGPCERVV